MDHMDKEGRIRLVHGFIPWRICRWKLRKGWVRCRAASSTSSKNKSKWMMTRKMAGFQRWRKRFLRLISWNWKENYKKNWFEPKLKPECRKMKHRKLWRSSCPRWTRMSRPLAMSPLICISLTRPTNRRSWTSWPGTRDSRWPSICSIRWARCRWRRIWGSGVERDAGS